MGNRKSFALGPTASGQRPRAAEAIWLTVTTAELKQMNGGKQESRPKKDKLKR